MHRALFLSALGFSLALASCGGSETATSGSAGGTTSPGGSGGAGGATTSASNGGGGAGGGNGGNGGSGGATTTGTTGTPGECTPDTMQACYTGAAGTEGQGICKGGTQKCKADGTWGLCIGEVTPLAETCATPVDDDCDGLVNEEGATCVCVPGEMGACYGGPPGTEDVGTCKGGMALCNPDGLGYATCTGQVLPALESCLAPSDEDCNGQALACTGSELFHKKFGDGGAQAGAGIAAWNGGAVIAGVFAGTVDFGGGGLVSGGANDAFVASYDYLGAHQWSKRFGDTVAQAATDVAVDGDGNVYVVADYAGKIDTGGGVQTSAGLTDIVLVKYDKAGVFQWSKSFGDSKAQNVTGVAVDDAGHVAITGSFIGDLAFGGDLLTSAGAANDVFVAVFDSDGGHVWSKRFGDTAAQVGKAIAFGPLGEVVIAGDLTGATDFGGGLLTSAGATDVFVASFDALGAHLWSKVFGNNVAQVASGVALDSVGNVVVAASFAGKIDFGGGLLTSAGGNDVGLAKLTTGGMHLWSKRLGSTGADNARGVAIDGFGTITVTGDFAASVDFGGGALASAGATDVFVAKYDPLGAHLWSKRAGDAGAQLASGIAADATGVFVTGTFAGAIDFGGGSQASAGGNDVFLVKLAQ